MKIYRLTIVVLLACFLGACNDWLTVNPEEEISEEDLFKTGEGYRNALNGVYRVMAGASLYGRELSYGLLGYIGQEYDKEETGNYGYRNAADYDWKVARTDKIITSVWEDTFNAIANCNNIVANIQKEDSTKFYLREKERKLIWGEALGLRALLHFDILRLFGASPADDKGEKYVPYVETYPVMFPDKLTTDEVLERVIRDLKEARELVAVYDTVNINMMSDIRLRLEYAGGVELKFLQNRGYRLNYYAVTALLARVYLYSGDYENAYKEADRLITKEKTKEGKDIFSFTSSTYAMGQGNIKFYEDIIFACYNDKLGNVEDEINKDKDLLILKNVATVFGSETSDRRYSYQTTKLDDGSIQLIKYKDQPAKTNSYAKVSTRLVPMLRMSEMYYIASEAALKYLKDKSKAEAYLQFVRGKRALGALPSSSTDAEFMKLLYQDMRREFLGDGQMFFQYKRLNRGILIDGGGEFVVGKNFIVPVPDSENI